MMNVKIKMPILAAILAAFFYVKPVVSGEQASIPGPCGADQQLADITKYFTWRWAAKHHDMNPALLQRWLKFHELEDRNPPIVLARLFSSVQQETIAVVAAWRFQNFLDGKLLVDVLCVAQTESGSFVRQYQPEALQKILSGPGSKV